jgi:hypothetical protein
MRKNLKLRNIKWGYHYIVIPGPGNEQTTTKKSECLQLSHSKWSNAGVYKESVANSSFLNYI